ncbi:MAG: phosphohydrolase [Prevotella sp.]|nr:phosphohydrolase [Prevotella sp.]
MNYRDIIDKYYPAEDELRRILLAHSRQVADRCLRISKAHPGLRLDDEFLEEAAMLHDIGIFRCHAPGIRCLGTEPYICHGIIGAELMRGEGWERHARVCERHTGTGLSAADIERQQLPLPRQDFVPVTLEEQVVCYADKFYSKTRPDSERTVMEAMRSLEKFGEAGILRFQKWVDMFE